MALADAGQCAGIVGEALSGISEKGREGAKASYTEGVALYGCFRDSFDGGGIKLQY